MYSRNDYRYYLENQLYHSDDFLAHYGVKGMKWKKRIKKGVKNEIAGVKRYYGIGNKPGRDVLYSTTDNTHSVMQYDPKTRRITKISKKKYKNGKIETALVKTHRALHPYE